MYFCNIYIADDAPPLLRQRNENDKRSVERFIRREAEGFRGETGTVLVEQVHVLWLVLKTNLCLILGSRCIIR